MLTVIVIITGMSICSTNSYCDNNDKKWRSMCSVSSYCDNIDNNGEVYMQC